jgi:hypothetical protein
LVHLFDYEVCFVLQIKALAGERLFVLKEALQFDEAVIERFHADDLVFHAVNEFFEVGSPLLQIIFLLFIEVGEVDVLDSQVLFNFLDAALQQAEVIGIDLESCLFARFLTGQQSLIDLLLLLLEGLLSLLWDRLLDLILRFRWLGSRKAANRLV